MIISQEKVDISSINTTCDKLEKERKKALFFFVLTIVLASLVGAGGFALIITSLILEGTLRYILLPLGIVCFFLGGGGGSVLALHISNKYAKHFFNRLVPLFGKKGYSSLMFSYKDKGTIESLRSFSKAPKFDEDEACLYTGSFCDGVSFFSYRYMKTKMGKGHPENVYGRYLEFRLPTSSKEEFILTPLNKSSIFTSSAKKEIRSESILVERKYQALASEETWGYHFFSPSIIELLSHYEDGTFSFLFKDNHLYVSIDDYSVYYSCKLSKKVTLENVLPLKKECELFASIYSAFDQSLK
jgi:hypothetical protein